MQVKPLSSNFKWLRSEKRKWVVKETAIALFPLFIYLEKKKENKTNDDEQHCEQTAKQSNPHVPLIDNYKCHSSVHAEAELSWETHVSSLLSTFSLFFRLINT